MEWIGGISTEGFNPELHTDLSMDKGLDWSYPMSVSQIIEVSGSREWAMG